MTMGSPDAVGVCGRCGREGRLGRRAREEHPDLCRRCARASQPKRECGICGRTRVIRIRARDGRPDICGNCAPIPSGICGICGRVQKIARKATASAPAVGRCCWKPPRARCIDCGRDRPCVRSGGPAPRCMRCHSAHQAKPCIDCGELRRACRRVERGVICQACDRRRASSTPCQQCGAVTRLVARRCPACRLKLKVAELRESGTPARVAALERYLQAIARAPVPLSTLRWLHTPTSGLLREILSGELELSHQALDERQGNASSSHAVGFLRAQFVHHEALPARDEESASFARWHARQTTQITNAGDRAHVRAYASWQVAHQLATPARRATPSRQKHARSLLGEAIKLTLWLHSQDLRLADLRQDLIDEWIAAGASTRRSVRPFTTWLARAGVTGVLQVAWNMAGPPGPPLTDQQRYVILRRLLHDPGVDLRDRIAGSLLLLYAQPLTRTAQLSTASITRREDGEVAIVLGRGPVLLPEPLASYALALHEQRRLELGTDGWLFQGQNAGQHLTSETLRERLKRYGLTSRPGRESALLALAARIPAPILAERIGIYPARAANWVRAAGATYADYVALRTP